jgi:hypothetical protein
MSSGTWRAHEFKTNQTGRKTSVENFLEKHKKNGQKSL